MEFDKSRVYTAVNADELPKGSKCIFADDLNMLRKKVQQAEQYTSELRGIREDCKLYRFRGPSDEQDEGHALAYLIEPPKEPQYKPFSSTEKAMEAISKHGGWVKNKYWGYLVFITGIDIGVEDGEEIQITNNWYSVPFVLENFVFADDGSPCGELVEE